MNLKVSNVYSSNKEVFQCTFFYVKKKINSFYCRQLVADYHRNPISIYNQNPDTVLFASESEYEVQLFSCVGKHVL